MNIVLHDYAGFAFPLELSSELSKRDNHVLHLFTYASGGPKTLANNNYSKNLQISNIVTNLTKKDNIGKRWLQERHYGNLVLKELYQWHPDVIISGNTPLEAQKKIFGWAYKHRIPSIFWLHDLLSVAAKSILSKINKTLGFILFNYLKKIEIKALNQASHIVSITEDFSPFLDRWQIDPAKISVIPNWGPIEQIPVLPRNNQFSDYYGLNDTFVLLYAGTLGKKQDIRLIADIADKLNDEIKFIIATDDRGHRLLQKHLTPNRCSSLIQLPLQSSRQYPYLLASSDATLVTLEASVDTYCVPSKLWSSFCAQKPTIVAVDGRNLAARVTKEINAGIVISPGATDECITAIRKLKTHPSLSNEMGKNARCYAERHFPIERIADQFEAIIQQVVVNDAGLFR